MIDSIRKARVTAASTATMVVMDTSRLPQNSVIPNRFMYCSFACAGAPLNTCASGESQKTWRSMAAL